MCSNNLKLPIRAAPYRHQRDAAAFALDRLVKGGGAALLMEMGTGKTLTTIAIVGRLWQEKRIQRLLVVAPLSILGVWEDEFRKFADYDYSCTRMWNRCADRRLQFRLIYSFYTGFRGT